MQMGAEYSSLLTDSSVKARSALACTTITPILPLESWLYDCIQQYWLCRCSFVWKAPLFQEAALMISAIKLHMKLFCVIRRAPSPNLDLPILLE
jgi:hypothetical protein